MGAIYELRAITRISFSSVFENHRQNEIIFDYDLFMHATFTGVLNLLVYRLVVALEI